MARNITDDDVKAIVKALLDETIKMPASPGLPNGHFGSVRDVLGHTNVDAKWGRHAASTADEGVGIAVGELDRVTSAMGLPPRT